MHRVIKYAPRQPVVQRDRHKLIITVWKCSSSCSYMDLQRLFESKPSLKQNEVSRERLSLPLIRFCDPLECGGNKLKWWLCLQSVSGNRKRGVGES
eukprot:2952478-Amphidinium_carterae.1